jgi:FixJ family two-component response regulator
MLDAVQLAIERDRKRRNNEGAGRELNENYGSLTPREREIMALVAAGLMNKQIAGEIGVTEVTVKLHRGNMMRKMGAKSVAELVRMADALRVSPKSQ